MHILRPNAKIQSPPLKIRHKIHLVETRDPQGQSLKNGIIDVQALSNGNYLGAPVLKDALSGILSVGFWNAIGPQNWGVDTHRNNGVKFMFLESGRMPLVVDHEEFHLQAGNFIIIRPGQLHQLGNPHIEPGKLHWLMLDVKARLQDQNWHWPDWIMLSKNDWAELTDQLRHHKTLVWNSTPDVVHSFAELARCVTGWNQPHNVSRMVIHVNLLLLGILDALTHQLKYEQKQNTSRRGTVEIFLRKLEQFHIDPAELWTLERMAAQCNMGTTAFSKYCRELVNVNPIEYLNQCRLERAARQLKENSGKTITEIALANGFNSSQYFATAFKQKFHKSPRAYRES